MAENKKLFKSQNSEQKLRLEYGSMNNTFTHPLRTALYGLSLASGHPVRYINSFLQNNLDIRKTLK